MAPSLRRRRFGTSWITTDLCNDRAPICQNFYNQKISHIISPQIYHLHYIPALCYRWHASLLKWEGQVFLLISFNWKKANDRWATFGNWQLARKVIYPLYASTSRKRLKKEQLLSTINIHQSMWGMAKMWVIKHIGLSRKYQRTNQKVPTHQNHQNLVLTNKSGHLYTS